MAFQGNILKIEDQPTATQPKTGTTFQGSVLKIGEAPKGGLYVPPVQKEPEPSWLESTLKKAKEVASTIRYMPEAIDETLGITKSVKEKGLPKGSFDILYSFGEAISTAAFRFAKGIIGIKDPKLAERLIPAETPHPTELLLKAIGKEKWIKTSEPVQIGLVPQNQVKEYINAGIDPKLAALMVGSQVIFDAAITGGIAEGILRGIAKPAPPDSMKAADARKVLNIKRSATPEDIKVAYYEKAHVTHPDKIGGSGIEFGKINKAYQTLTGVKPVAVGIREIAYDLVKERPYPWQKIAKESIITPEAPPVPPEAIKAPPGVIIPAPEVPPKPPIPPVAVKPIVPIVPPAEEVGAFGERFQKLTPAQKAIYKNKLAKLRTEGQSYDEAKYEALIRAEKYVVPTKAEVPPEIAPVPPEAIKEAISAEKGIIPQVAKDWGAEVKGNKVILYHGTNDPKFTPNKLNYGTFLSSVEKGTDITGNAGASSYGKYVHKLELSLTDVDVSSTGEFRYIGKVEIPKGAKYPTNFYKEYNDYFGSNLTPKEIDKQTDVWDIAKAISGYNEVKAKQLLGQIPKEIKAIPPELQPLAQEARSAKNVNEFVASTIFEKSLAGEETKALESFAGETTADKLSTFYNQAVKGVKEVKPEVGRPFELKGLPAKGQVLRNIESAEKELRKAYKPAAEKVNEELGKFWAELEMAEAGERIPIREARPDVLEGEIVSWLGKTSSFPKWIPEDLRKKDLLNEVMAGLTDINNIKYPVGNRSAQRELYNIILDELDARVGIDTTEIRDRILDSYEEIPKAEISEAVGEGAPRRAELAPEEEIKVEEIFPKAKEVKPEIPEKLKDLAKWAETFTKKEFRNVIHRATESKERTVEQQKIVDSLLYLEEMKLPKPVIENFWELVNQVEKDIKFYENKLKELEKYTPEEFARISAGASLEAEKTIFREALMKLRARIGVEEKPKEVSKKGERIFGYSLTGQFELEIFKKLGEFRVFDKDKALTILDTEKEARAFIDAYVDGFEKGVRKDFEPSKRAGLFYLKDENKNIVVRTDEEGVLDAYIDGYNSGVDRKLGATEMEKDEPFSEKEVVREPTGEISEKTAREIVIDDLKSNLDSTPNEFLKSYGGMSGEDYSIGYDGYQWDQPQAKPNYEAIEMHKKNIAELEKKVAIATARGKDSFRQALDNEKFLLEWEEDALRKRNIDKVFFTDERTEKKYEFSLKELWAEAGGKDFEFKPEITDLLGEERGYYLKGKEVKMPVKGGRWKVGEKEYTRSDLEFLAKRTSLTIGRKVTPAEYLHELMKEQESIGKKVSEEQKKYEIQRETRKKFSFIGETSVVRIKLEENGYLLTKNAKIESPTDVAFIFSELKNESREKAFAVNLDADNKIINVDYMSLGSTNAGLINPKEVFRSGVISGAKSIYLIHNHPTGDVSPSSDDLDIFLRLRRVAEILDIKWNGAIIMDRSEFGFVSKDNVETIPYKETKEGKEIIRVVEPKQVIKNPFLAKQIINSPDKAAGLTRAILHKDTNAILAIYLDTRLGVVEIDVKAFSLDNVDYKTFAKDLIKGAMLNNATGLVITSNAELSEKISFFQEVDSMFKFADLELMDVVQVSVNLRESLIDVIRPRKIGGKEEPMMKEKYREIPLTPEELQAFDYVQNRLPMPENLKPAMEMLKKRGLLRADYISPTEPPKITKAARRKVPLGTIKEEQIAKIKLAAEEKKLSRETFAQLRNGFTGHNRTKLEELSTEQADQLFKEILDLTPDKMGKIRLVDAETLEVMKDFIPPGLLTKRAITTGDIFNNLTEPQVSYIVSLFRPIRKVLTSGELLPNEKKVSERIYDDISLAEEDRNIEYRDWHKKYAELYKSARKKDKNVDVNVFGYIEQDWEVPVKTKELAEFLKDFYSASLPVMKPLRVRQKYITHTAPTFWETVKKIGLKGTLKQIIEPNIAREERIDPGIIINLEYIVSKEKFNPFALPRSEYTAYSKKLRKSVNAYASLYFYKNNFDPIMPKVLKRSQFLPPETQKYVKKYLQTVGGRPIGHELWRGPFGRTAKSLINMGVRFEYGILLGANVPSSLGNAAGGTWNNISDIPPDLLALGNKRLSTKQGRRILDKYRLTEQTLWLEPVGGVIERMSKAERGLFVLMQGGEFYMRGSAALARIPEDEFQSGNLSPRTRAIIRRQIGRTQGLFGPAQAPLLSQFTLLRPVWMFKHWMVNEMELWNNFIKEAVSRAKRNPGWRGKIIGNAGVRKILKYIIIGALFYLFGPEFLKKEMRQKIMIPAQLIATFTNWADSVPLVEDLILAENLSVRIANREFNEAREDFINWVKTKGSIKKFADLLEGIQKGTVSSPDGLLKEYLEPQEAIKRFFLGTWTEKGQKEQKLNEELSKLLPFESYTKWDQAFGARKVKTDYQKIKEDILQYIEKKKYWTPPEKEGESGTLALDQQILRMYAIYNGKALKRLDNFFTDAEKLTGQKIEDKEKDSLRMKVTIQEKDIANWVQTKYEQEMIPRLLRRVK